jgi:hypothetical protein
MVLAVTVLAAVLVWSLVVDLQSAVTMLVTLLVLPVTGGFRFERVPRAGASLQAATGGG